MDFDLSRRMNRITSSAIREILKVTENPAVISFAGGVPAPETFPVELIKQASSRILSVSPGAALQYASTEGYGPLREWIAARHGVPQENVLITTGSQQGLDLLGKVLIDPGERVLVENPSYLGALQAFSLFDPALIPVRCDQDGILPEALRETVAAGARCLYTMPNFQNPTGKRMPLERRRQMLDAVQPSRALVIEDDPYGDLTFDGLRFPSLLSMAPDRVVYLGSFSKIIAPGLRVGYAIAPTSLMKKLVQAKQAGDLHTSGFCQRLIHEVLLSGMLPAHIERIQSLYRTRRDAMLRSLETHARETLSWNRPEGGMFLWARMREPMDSVKLLETALAPEHGAPVAFVPGAPFYAGTPDQSSLRLSFVTNTEERIEEGIVQLAKALDRHRSCATAEDLK